MLHTISAYPLTAYRLPLTAFLCTRRVQSIDVHVNDMTTAREMASVLKDITDRKASDANAPALPPPFTLQPTTKWVIIHSMYPQTALWKIPADQARASPWLLKSVIATQRMPGFGLPMLGREATVTAEQRRLRTLLMTELHGQPQAQKGVLLEHLDLAGETDTFHGHMMADPRGHFIVDGPAEHFIVTL